MCFLWSMCLVDVRCFNSVLLTSGRHIIKMHEHAANSKMQAQAEFPSSCLLALSIPFHRSCSP